MSNIMSSLRESALQEALPWIWLNHTFIFGLCVLILLVFGLIYFSRKLKYNLNLQLMIGAELEKQLEEQAELLDKTFGLLTSLKDSSEKDNINDRIRLVE